VASGGSSSLNPVAGTALCHCNSGSAHASSTLVHSFSPTVYPSKQHTSATANGLFSHRSKSRTGGNLALARQETSVIALAKLDHDSIANKGQLAEHAESCEMRLLPRFLHEECVMQRSNDAFKIVLDADKSD
jgi:hypothetical protein